MDPFLSATPSFFFQLGLLPRQLHLPNGSVSHFPETHFPSSVVRKPLFFLSFLYGRPPPSYQLKLALEINNRSPFPQAMLSPFGATDASLF